jgi:hypothetical protein
MAAQPDTCAGYLIGDLVSWLAMRVGEPGYSTCAPVAGPARPISIRRTIVLYPVPFPYLEPMLWRPLSRSRHHPLSTKTPFKLHTRRCRVRRKRKRLTSNDSIESDAALSRSLLTAGFLRRVTSDRGLTFSKRAI